MLTSVGFNRLTNLGDRNKGQVYKFHIDEEKNFDSDDSIKKVK
jgi:hypothetical protein